MGHTLRDYQIEGVEDGMKVMLAKSKKGIVVQPTGAGKSHIVAEIVKRLTDTPIVVLQPSKELLKQNYSKYVKIGGEASIYCSSLKKKTIKKKAYTEIDGELKRCDEISRVTYATVGSIKKEIASLIEMGVKHILIDEVHLMSKVGSQIRDFIKKLKATNVLGLTATPIYLQGGMNGSRLVMINRSFATMFRSIVHVTQIKELVDNGYWTPFVYKIIKGDDSKLEMNTSGSDYTEYSQKLYYESNGLKNQIVEEVKKLKAGGRKRILIFVPSIAEANELYRLIPNSAIVHSKLSMDERDFMVEAFTNGDIPVAINVNVLATGYDNPEIDAIITSRPTSSIAIFYQQIGRGCRLYEGKENCIITDFSGNTQRFGRVEEITFEEIEGYGWGMWNGRGELLSDYPIMTSIKPTKESLIKSYKKEEEKKKVGSREPNNPEFNFGKFKGRKFNEIHNKNPADLKSYCIWISSEHKDGNWEFYGKKGEELKDRIYEYLKLPTPNSKKVSTDDKYKLPF